MISTHVLDTEVGRPKAGVKVSLYREEQLVSDRQTDEDGRIAELSDGRLEPGVYRLAFDLGGTFFERVELSISVGADAHYHVPLLVSPYSCVIYRGS